MTAVDGRIPHALGLRAGDLVEIRTEREILRTLDEDGKLDGLPLMPEMLQYCGSRVRVFRRADKTCDTVSSYWSRRMADAVHLEGLRCDGGQHGGCQAGCLLFWKEAWLRRVREGDVPGRVGGAPRSEGLTRADLEGLTTRPVPASADERVYVCQATELPRATTALAWWDPRQYWRELRSRNVGLGTFLQTLATAGFNLIQRRLGRLPYPRIFGTLEGRTPSRRLDLQPGERVRVRSREEIMATLNTKQRNRGMWFDVEMVAYCGGEYRVLRRVTQIINERTGKMMQLPGDCIILDGVVCKGYLSRNRLFCPRSIYPYWREIWLERVP
jgi:hypothetical protein